MSAGPGGNEISCDGYAAECAALRCPYGVQRVRAADGCVRCVCVPVDVDCGPLRQECDTLKCNYGMERVTGDDGCERLVVETFTVFINICNSKST